jgi:hypothetical protein
VILRLVRRPYGLHAIGPQDPAIIQTHASPLLGTVFGFFAISVILRLVRRPYGLHAIPAIIQTHAIPKARVPSTGAAGATRTKRMRGWSHAYQATVFGLSAISVILRLVRRPYGLHAIPAIIQTHASPKARRPIACEP